MRIFSAKEFPTQQDLLNHAKQEVLHAITQNNLDQEIVYIQIGPDWAQYLEVYYARTVND